MLFNSYVFVLAFLPVFLIVFAVLRRASYGKEWRGSACKWLIVAGSLIFYAPFGAKNMAVLVLSVMVNGFIVWRFPGKRGKDEEEQTNQKETAESITGQNRGALALTVGINVAALLMFKFWGKIPGNSFAFFPVAVSFYTFSQISFLVDMYRGEIEEFVPANYLSYILFFPKLLQGPLMGYCDFVRELDRAIDYKSSDSQAPCRSDGRKNSVSDKAQLSPDSFKAVEWERVMRGLLLFSMGLFKKVILADTFGKAVDFGYSDVSTLGSLEAVFVAVFYSFQLYFDFSGYCDMASGICTCMGFELPMNFNSPYKAESIVDFWKRWHITLTAFFTKYVYIPLGGNRKGTLRMCVNFMIVFLLSGLWHGNGVTFIVWGAMHGVLFVITRLIMKRGKSERVRSVGGLAARAGHVVKVILTFTYVTVAWVFFRAPSVADALTLLKMVFIGGIGPIATPLSSAFQLDELWYIIKVSPVMKLSFAWDFCLWLFLIGSSAMIFFSKNAASFCAKCRIGVRTTLLTAFLLVWCILSFAGVSTFLYMNF